MAVLMAASVIWTVAIGADQARYFYDELGRLVAVADGQGNTAIYAFDAVGNLLSISRGTATAPTVTSITPDPIDAGVSTLLTITGTEFQFARLTFSNGDVLSSV